MGNKGQWWLGYECSLLQKCSAVGLVGSMHLFILIISTFIFIRTWVFGRGAGDQIGASCLLGKRSTTERNPQPLFISICLKYIIITFMVGSQYMYTAHFNSFYVPLPFLPFPSLCLLVSFPFAEDPFSCFLLKLSQASQINWTLFISKMQSYFIHLLW